MAGERDMNERQERCIRGFGGNSEGQRPLGRPGNRRQRILSSLFRA